MQREKYAEGLEVDWSDKEYDKIQEFKNAQFAKKTINATQKLSVSGKAHKKVMAMCAERGISVAEFIDAFVEALR